MRGWKSGVRRILEQIFGVFCRFESGFEVG